MKNPENSDEKDEEGMNVLGYLVIKLKEREREEKGKEKLGEEDLKKAIKVLEKKAVKKAILKGNYQKEDKIIIKEIGRREGIEQKEEKRREEEKKD